MKLVTTVLDFYNGSTMTRVIMTHIVSTRKNVPLKIVEDAFNKFIEYLYYVLGCGSSVLIPGFGLFIVESDGELCFTRTNGVTNDILFDHTNTTSKIRISPGYDQRLINDIMVRLKHLPDDPIAISVFIEVNRYLFYKKKTVDILRLGRFKPYGSDIIGRSFFSNKYSQELVRKTRPKVNIWIPRLVTLLKDKMTVEEQ